MLRIGYQILTEVKSWYHHPTKNRTRTQVLVKTNINYYSSHLKRLDIFLFVYSSFFQSSFIYVFNTRITIEF